MRFIVLFCVTFALFAIAKAEEGCTYGGITYPKGRSPISGKCQTMDCDGGDNFDIKYCPIASVHCKDPSLYYETPYDYSKDQPECCPKYGCREE